MLVAVSVLPFDVDDHRITPTSPDPEPLMPVPSKQQHQQRVLVTWIPKVPMGLPSSGAGLHQWWEWSNAQ
jgi:hypothetical protein